MDLWEVFLPGGLSAVFHEDNLAMIRVFETGKNPSMKHVGRCHGINVQFTHEMLRLKETKDPIDLLYADSLLMCADIYNKQFDAKEKWERAIRFINAVDPNKLVENN
jgi:SpoU rRNA methylase family enzyme